MRKSLAVVTMTTTSLEIGMRMLLLGLNAHVGLFRAENNNLMNIAHVHFCKK